MPAATSELAKRRSDDFIAASPSSPASADAPLPGLHAGRCYHCERPNSPGRRWTATLDGARRDFCCAGCLAIAQTIQGAGLESFYALRTATAASDPADAAHDDRWLEWDAAAVHERLVRILPDGNREIALLLEGIQCSACIWLIESWLCRQPGVRHTEINYAMRRARMVWDPTVSKLSDLLRAIAAIGYRAYPYDPERREVLARAESRTLLLRLAVALLAMMQVMMLAVPTYVTVDGVEPLHERLLQWASLTLTLPAILYSAWPFFRGAMRDLALRRAGMDVPVALGLVFAFAASLQATLAGEGAVYYDSVTMFIALLLLARYLEAGARRRASEAIEATARARPATAERLTAWPATRCTETVSAHALVGADRVLVRPGSRIPADGRVLEGDARVDEALLTGEALPIAKRAGAAILAGSVVTDGALVIEVEAVGEATVLAAIERLAERAACARPRVARLADRFAGAFVGVLLGIAAVTAIAWGLLDPTRVVAVTFAVLVVSCPCALSLATPAALAAAAGALARRHIVIARPDALEAFARVTHVVFDKTGTLTTGRYALLATYPTARIAHADAHRLAAALEATSEHAIARALRKAAAPCEPPPAEALTLVVGCGVEGTIGGRRLRVGRPEFVAELCSGPAPQPPQVDDGHTQIALGDAAGLLATFVLGDAPRADAGRTIAELVELGVTPVMLSGDRSETARALGRALGIDIVHGDALPEDKRSVIAALQAEGAVVAMIGDGINDAPALAQAQVSMSLRSATSLAQQTCDVVALGDDLPSVSLMVRHARRTFAVVRQNLGWALAYNALAIPAAACGWITPLAAAAGMSLSSLLVIGNALRAGRLEPNAVRAVDERAARA